MSLDWNLTKVKDWREMQDKESERTDVLIWGTLSVGLGSITEKNVEEWMLRARILEGIGLNLAQNQDGPMKLPRAWVERRIGLSTNVFPNKSRAQFLKGLGKILVEQAQRELRVEREEAA